jgi:chaperonin GroEL
MLTTECMIAESAKADAPAGGMGGDMGGMGGMGGMGM